jgi:hypothetical protein
MAAFETSQRRNQSVLTYPSPGETASGAVGQELSQTRSQISRSTPLGTAVRGMERPAGRSGDRQTGHRHRVAPQGLSLVRDMGDPA